MEEASARVWTHFPSAGTSNPGSEGAAMDGSFLAGLPQLQPLTASRHSGPFHHCSHLYFSPKPCRSSPHNTFPLSHQ